MSEVTLNVGGRPYTVSCADGEEAHVEHLAAIVDSKLSALGGNRAPGDAKNLLFAALFLADEVEELRRRGAPAAPFSEHGQSAHTLEALAVRLEHLAQVVENTAAGD